MRLNLMSGHFPVEGYDSLDATCPADWKATVPPLPAELRGGVIDECIWLHGPGQLPPWQTERLLHELFIEMNDEGKLIIETPDFNRCLDSRKVEWIYGDPALKRENHLIRWGWTPETLSLALVAAGWRRVEIKAAQFHIPERDFRVEAWK